MNLTRTLPQFFSDTGQKKTPDKKDGRRMSFQKPKGTIEYSVSCCLIIRMSLQSKCAELLSVLNISKTVMCVTFNLIIWYIWLILTEIKSAIRQLVVLD